MMTLTMESHKFTHMDSLHFDSRKCEPLPSLRSFYATDTNEQGEMLEDAEHSLIWRAASPKDLPSEAVMQIMTSQLLDRKVVASMTGPDSGFQVAREWKDRSMSKTLVCGTHVFVDNWKEIPHPRAFGKSISLYDTNPVTGRTSGDPIADAFVVKVRSNSAFMAVADGVNWGEAPMRAARCAINAVYEHLETNFLLGGPQALKIRNTRDVADLLFSAFRQAHLDIVAQTRGLTTLCVGLLLPVHIGERHRHYHRRHQSGQSSGHSAASTSSLTTEEGTTTTHALVVASVGDSQVFILRDGNDALEVTGWVPPNNDSSGADCEAEGPPERDFRDAGGALGPVYESGEPELQNLMCAVSICNPRDLLIFGTDGLTDNFDPVIVRIAIPRAPDISFADENDERGEEGVAMPSDLSKSHFTSTKNWAKMTPIASPYSLPIWPKPPPPPPLSNSSTSGLLSSPAHDFSFSSASPDTVSARSLNYTNQLELTWPERRKYVSKELTRIWYELERTGCGEVSAVDYGEALLKHVKRVTAQKRQFLEAPETTKLKAQFSRYMRKKNSLRENDRSRGTSAAIERISTEEVDKELCELERRRAWLMDSMRRMPGKLDHATVVVLQMGPN
nr:PP2C domain containing protein [Hymenolepis microstoma]